MSEQCITLIIQSPVPAGLAKNENAPTELTIAASQRSGALQMVFFIRSSRTGLKPREHHPQRAYYQTHRHAPVRVIKARKRGVSVALLCLARHQIPAGIEASG